MNRNISAIVVDDELNARQLLSTLIQDYIPMVKVVDLCCDIPSSVKSIRKYKPDLVFLDIEMPGYSGLELLNFFNEDEINFHIIFTTAYHQYSIQAFKLSAVDYLLKPIDPEDLKSSVDRYLSRDLAFKNKYDVLLNNLQNEKSKKLVVSTTTFIKYVDVESIIYIQADGAYSKIVYGNNESVYSSKALKYYDEIFSKNPHFMRTHKSYLINLTKVQEYIRADGGSIKMVNGNLVGISSEKLADFLRLMSDLKS